MLTLFQHNSACMTKRLKSKFCGATASAVKVQITKVILLYCKVMDV